MVDGSQLRQRDRTVFRALAKGAGGVLLDLDSGEYRRFNATGAIVWGCLGQGLTRAALVDEVRSKVKDPPPDLDAQVRVFLETLIDRGLVHEVPPETAG